jgi:hypothetical protein
MIGAAVHDPERTRRVRRQQTRLCQFGDEVVRSLEPISERRRVVAVSAMTAGSWPLDGRGVGMTFDKLDGAFCQNRILSLKNFSSSHARMDSDIGERRTRTPIEDIAMSKKVSSFEAAQAGRQFC